MSIWHLLVLLLLLAIAGGATAILWMVGRDGPGPSHGSSGTHGDSPH